jgi:5'(3')-deoxyribonucleotidase
MAKKKLLADVDGVFADFTGRVLQLVAELTGKVFTAVDVKTWEIFDSLEVPEGTREKVYGILRQPGGCESLSPYPGAAEGLRLVQGVAEVVFVTSPFSRAPTWPYERQRWLERHLGVDPKRVIHALDKSHVCGDAFLDDNHDHLRAWGKAWPSRLRLHWMGNGTGFEPEPSAVPVRTWQQVVEWLAR